MLRESRAQSWYRARFVHPLSKRLHRFDFGANGLSLVALLAAVAGGAAFVFEPVVGGALYLVSGTVDTLDGAVSRRAGTASRAGAFLDSVLDRYAELLILLGVLGFYAQAGRLSAAVALITLLAGYGSWMVSYTQSRAEGLSIDCSYGWFERPERVLLLALGGIVSPIDIGVTLPDFMAVRPLLGLSLVLLALGANATAITRLRSGYRELRRDDEPSRLIERMKAYLEASFPSHAVSWEWDTARRAVVFRIARHGKTMLVELSDEVRGEVGASVWIERIARWDLCSRLREHPRILVTPRGLKPLPWRQLAPQRGVIDEEIRETFPASDASSPSSIT